MKKIFLMIAIASFLPSCATIISGTSQEIAVNTNPAGASCDLIREGKTIARVESTPGTVTVDKTKHHITIICDKPGYQQVTYTNKSGNEGATLGNIIAGGGIGWAVDSAAGSDNKYESPVHISLVPATASATPTAVAPVIPMATPVQNTQK